MSAAILTALVLGAGSSRRLGQPKQLLPYHGTTLLGWVVAQAEACAALDEVLVVLGHENDAVRASLALGRAGAVLNTEYQEGCAASYRAGLAGADPRAAGVLILPGDQPGITSAMIARVAADWRASGAELVAADYQGTLGHPLVFGRALFPDLAALHGDKAAWKLVDRAGTTVRRVPMGCALPADVDTPADAARLARSE
ncbi:MAG TPA: nucleotidyltransferase family protein [Ktedonobacterales bacterium]|nr:nucleotidyltransferase family protein [Ktedonobacterales bacterium]